MEPVGIGHDKILVATELPLLDQVDGLDAGDDFGGRVEGLEPRHWAGSVVQLDEVVQVFRLAKLDVRTAALVQRG